MIILGVVLLLIGLFAGVGILTTIGIILLVVGAVLYVAGLALMIIALLMLPETRGRAIASLERQPAE